MPLSSPLPPKPRNEKIRPELTRLPRLTFGRRMVRFSVRWLARFLVWLCTRPTVKGLNNIPGNGPLLVVSNHLGDTDVIIGMAYTPRMEETLAKAELYDLPFIGKLLDAYGVIWIHRGSPDRRALRAALKALEEGRMVAIAPEGRESLLGALEEGTNGAAYLALKARVPLIPVTFTGTENARVYTNLKHLRRTPVTMTIGPTFQLQQHADQKTAIQNGTQVIMQTLAAQLPPEYRGIYSTEMTIKRPSQATPGQEWNNQQNVSRS